MENNICHISGLQIRCKPEWSSLQITPNLSVTFKQIGNQILSVEISGTAGTLGIHKLFLKKAEFSIFDFFENF